MEPGLARVINLLRRLVLLTLTSDFAHQCANRRHDRVHEFWAETVIGWSGQDFLVSVKCRAQFA